MYFVFKTLVGIPNKSNGGECMSIDNNKYLISSAVDRNLIGLTLQPMPSLTLPTGPSGTGIPAALFAFDSVSSQFGNAIVQLNSDTFILYSTGFYKINLVVYPSIVSFSEGLGKLTIEQNGVPIPGVEILSKLNSIGIPIIIQLITFSPESPAIIEVLINGSGLSLFPGISASIIIEKIV